MLRFSNMTILLNWSTLTGPLLLCHHSHIKIFSQPFHILSRDYHISKKVWKAIGFSEDPELYHYDLIFFTSNNFTQIIYVLRMVKCLTWIFWILWIIFFITSTHSWMNKIFLCELSWKVYYKIIKHRFGIHTKYHTF